MRAIRSKFNNRFFFLQTINNGIQKTSDNKTKNKKENNHFNKLIKDGLSRPLLAYTKQTYSHLMLPAAHTLASSFLETPLLSTHQNLPVSFNGD